MNKITAEHIQGILDRAKIRITGVTYLPGSTTFVDRGDLPNYIANVLNEDMAIMEGRKNLKAAEDGAYLEYKTISTDINEEMTQLMKRCKHTLQETHTAGKSTMVVCKICGTILEQETHDEN